MTTKLEKITKNGKYKRAQEIKKVYQNIRLRKSLKSYAIKNYKAEISDTVSKFKSYINSCSITNIKLKGLKWFSYLKYQFERLNQFYIKNPSMKILIETSFIFERFDEEGELVDEFKTTLLSRRYEINNLSDLHNSLNRSAGDI